MPPKKRGLAMQVHMEIRRDAITSDSLHATNYIEFLTPDGSAKLYYNISTLLRIGETKGYMMQPPHFREKMSTELHAECERKLGRPINIAPPAPTAGGGGGGVEEEVDPLTRDLLMDGLHRDDLDARYATNNLDDVLAQFSKLSDKQCYVCPACFHHVIKKNNLRPRVKAHGMCPLDVIDNVEDEQLKHFVFIKNTQWTKHVKNHHGSTDQSGPAGDNRVRDYINTHLSRINRALYMKEKYEKRNNTTFNYWKREAGWNRYRYNQLIDKVTAFHSSGDDLTTEAAFDDVPAVWDEGDLSKHGTHHQSSSSDDDDEDGDDSSSNSSDEEEESDSDSSSCSDDSEELAAMYERRVSGQVKKQNLFEDEEEDSDDNLDYGDEESSPDLGESSVEGEDNVVAVTEQLMKKGRRKHHDRRGLTMHEQRFLHKQAQNEDDGHDESDLRDPDGPVQLTIAEMARRHKKQQEKYERLSKTKYERHKRARDNASLPTTLRSSSSSIGSGRGNVLSKHPCIAQYGSCRSGDSCPWTDLRGDVCVHWLKSGSCRFAEKCWYRHERIPAEKLGCASSSSSSSLSSDSDDDVKIVSKPSKKKDDDMWEYVEEGDSDEVSGMGQEDFATLNTGRDRWTTNRSGGGNDKTPTKKQPRRVSTHSARKNGSTGGGTSSAKKKKGGTSPMDDFDEVQALMRPIEYSTSKKEPEKKAPTAGGSSFFAPVGLIDDDDD